MDAILGGVQAGCRGIYLGADVTCQFARYVGWTHLSANIKNLYSQRATGGFGKTYINRPLGLVAAVNAYARGKFVPLHIAHGMNFVAKMVKNVADMETL